MPKYKVGYTQGVFDMFHIGHLALINHAAEHCEKLIVGVNSDALVQEYKKKTPVINEFNRAEIIRNLKAVDDCIIVETLDKVEVLKQYKFDAIFIGDDWKGNARWSQTEKDLAEYGVDVVYLPHTPDVSSTRLREEEPNRVTGE
ncbi:MAG: adenylyltransferase/cytidyltransferase family protein [Lachnospiraceae bacterium]|nr:adenylyltransferase/cytidyltransferase family protein [Lachnospiraceae bacterium]